MQQLTGLDTMFSSLDTETLNGMLGGLVRLAPPTDGRTHADAAFMRDRIAERLPYLPPLHRRVVRVPLGVQHDYLGRADRIDLLRHVRSIRLPHPGTQAQLEAELSRLMSTSLDPDVPPWDYTVIEGLQDGSVAHFLRIHHLVVDGGSMPILWDALADQPAAALVLDPGAEHHEPRWGRPEMLARELAGVALAPAQLVALLGRYAAWQAGQIRAHGPLAAAALPLRVLLPGPLATPAKRLLDERLVARGLAPIAPYLPTLSAPRTPFNGRVGSDRTFAFLELPLGEVRALSKGLGASINDVVLGVCAGAMRRHLLERGLPVDRPLVVTIPVSIRAADETLQWANFVHMIVAELPTHLDDPIARIRAAKASVGAAKANFDALPVPLLREASRFLPPGSLELAARLIVKLPDRLSRAPHNVIVSNIKGPSAPATLDGVEVRGYHPASFLTIGGGINITLQSYVDRLCFGVIANPQQAGRAAELARHLESALAETVAAVGRAAVDGIPAGMPLAAPPPAPRAAAPRAASDRARTTVASATPGARAPRRLRAVPDRAAGE